MDLHLAPDGSDGAADQAHELAAAGADETEETEDFAAFHRERNRGAQTGPGEIAHVEAVRTVEAGAVVVDVGELAADHALHERVAGDGGERLVGDDVAAVAEDGGGVADLVDLVHAVGHVEDGVALGLEVANDLEEPRGLLGGEAARGLVEGDDAGAAPERLGDLDHLALRDREAAELGVGRDVLADEREQTRGLRAESGVIEEQTTTRVAADQEVFRDRHLGHEMELLINDGDAGGDCLGGRGEDALRAVEAHGAGGRVVGAAEDFKQRGFAGAVFAHQRVNAAAAHGEGDAVERAHAGELLGERDELQRRG